ncbi:beta galactofuranosyl glycosyltransferase, putative, partial [Trypanosoma cruzi]
MFVFVPGAVCGVSDELPAWRVLLGRSSLFVRTECKGRYPCVIIALEGIFFFYTLTRSHSCAPSFSFLLFFAFFKEILPWLCLQRDMRRVTRALKTEATSLFWKRCFIFLLTLNLLSMLMFFFFGVEFTHRNDPARGFGGGPSRADHIRCVGERLLVDPTTRQLGGNNGTEVIPLMVVPLMLDLMDFWRMVCNISVPIRLLVLVQNGREAMLSLYLQELERVYGWSGRLVVSRHPENIGYSAAVNIGLRIALSLPREEVPFVFVTNSDVM